MCEIKFCMNRNILVVTCNRGHRRRHKYKKTTKNKNLNIHLIWLVLILYRLVDFSRKWAHGLLNTYKVGHDGPIWELSLFRGFPRSLYSIRSPDTPKIFFKLSGLEKVVFWATPISSVGKFLTLLRNGVKT